MTATKQKLVLLSLILLASCAVDTTQFEFIGVFRGPKAMVVSTDFHRYSDNQASFVNDPGLATTKLLTASLDRKTIAYAGLGQAPDLCSGICLMSPSGTDIRSAHAVSDPVRALAISNNGQIAFQKELSTAVAFGFQHPAYLLVDNKESPLSLSAQAEFEFSASGKYLLAVSQETVHIFNSKDASLASTFATSNALTWWQAHPKKDELYYQLPKPNDPNIDPSKVPNIVVKVVLATGVQSEFVRFPSVIEADEANTYMHNLSPLLITRDGKSLATTAIHENKNGRNLQADDGITGDRTGALVLQDMEDLAEGTISVDIHIRNPNVGPSPGHLFDMSAGGEVLVTSTGIIDTEQTEVGPQNEGGPFDADMTTLLRRGANSIYFLD